MMKSDIKAAQEFLSASELSEMVRVLDERMISSIGDQSSPYHAVYQIGRDKGKIVEYRYPNLRFILQDSIVSPVADATLSQLGLKRFVKRGNHHLFEENGKPFLYYLKDFGVRENLESCFDVKRVAEQMATKVSDAIQKGESAYSFYVAKAGKRFMGINLDEFIWDNIASKIESVFLSYEKEKFSNFSQSSYFSRPYGAIDMEYLNDVLAGDGLRSAKTPIGTKNIVNETHNANLHHRISEKNLKFPLKYDRILGDIASHIADEIKANPKLTGESVWVSPIYKKYFSHEGSSASFLAWMRGRYYDRPGAIVSPVNRSILVEKDISLSLDWVSECDMTKLTEGIWEKSLYYFKKIKPYDSVELHTGCSSRYLAWGDYDSGLVPKKVMSLAALHDGINYIIQQKIEKKGVSLY